MNTRSLKFQLIAWYAGLLVGGLTLLGFVAFLDPPKDSAAEAVLQRVGAR